METHYSPGRTFFSDTTCCLSVIDRIGPQSVVREGSFYHTACERPVRPRVSVIIYCRTVVVVVVH